MPRKRNKGLFGLGAVGCSTNAYGMQAGKVYITRVRLNASGYDSNGRYWGQGEPLFAIDDGAEYGHVRAASRAQAKAKIKERCPSAKFYR